MHGSKLDGLRVNHVPVTHVDDAADKAIVSIIIFQICQGYQK